MSIFKKNLKYHVLNIAVHRHSTIVTNETFATSSVGSCLPLSDRTVYANIDLVNSLQCTVWTWQHYMSLFCDMPKGMVTHKSILGKPLQNPYFCAIWSSNKKL